MEIGAVIAAVIAGIIAWGLLYFVWWNAIASLSLKLTKYGVHDRVSENGIDQVLAQLVGIRIAVNVIAVALVMLIVGLLWLAF